MIEMLPTRHLWLWHASWLFSCARQWRGPACVLTSAAMAVVLAGLVYWQSNTACRNEDKPLTDKRSLMLAGDAGLLNDTARALAGMNVSAGSFLEPLTRDKAFAKHSELLNRAWDAVEARQLAKVRAWSSENLTRPQPALFYMFSGPDFLYANAFFPKAVTYVMAGLEAPGDIPDLARLPRPAIASELAGLRASLKSILGHSFFITREMQRMLNGRRLAGTLPVLFVFLARSGNTITSVSFVTIDENGTLHSLNTPQEKKGKAAAAGAMGVKITFSGDGSQLRTLFYFKTDLSNRGTKKSGFLKFCRQFGTGDSLLKAASYLVHHDNFSNVRSFLLGQSAAIVQDDSGIPLRDFNAQEWDLKPFGQYTRPIRLFTRSYQPDLKELFAKESAQPLEFNLGYQARHGGSGILLAVRTR